MYDLRDAADIAKGRVSALEEGKRMGLEPDRSGFCRCPFHQEKTASMKLYKGEGGFHCYGCGAHGDVIRLVMAYYGINFRQALLRLDSEWGLGLRLSGRPLSQEEKRAAQRRQELLAMNRDTERRWRETALEAYYSACRLVDGFLQQIRDNAPPGPCSDWNEAFCDGLRNLADARETANDLALMVMECESG